MSAQVTFHLSAEDVRTIASGSARAELRRDLAAHLARRRAARILDEHAIERAALRAAARDAQAQRDNAPSHLARAALPAPNLELLADKRRAEYKAALAYPMTPAEVLRAAIDVCAAGKYPDDDARSETVSELVRVVLRRHGKTPLRCDVGVEWLTKLAERIYVHEQRKREHKSGMQRAAAELKSWQADDEHQDHEQRTSDPVMFRAQNMPAPPETERPEDAHELARKWRVRLGLTAKQAEALGVAISARKRTTFRQRSSEREAARAARAVLRKRFPDQLSLVLALHPEQLPERALLAARHDAAQRASSAARGTHLPGGTLSSASALPLRRFTRAAQPAPEPAPVIGPLDWSRIGDGYSGSCPIAGSLRRWAAAQT